MTDHELVGRVEQTLARLTPDDDELRCRLLTALAFEHGTESERGYEASAQAMELAQRLGDPSALTKAINGRYFQSHRHDGLAVRRRPGAELLALPGKPVTAEAIAYVFLMAANSGTADFAAADLHADQAARIADRYDLPVFATSISIYRAMRTALDGDLTAAGELYQQAAAQMDRLGLWQHGRGGSILGRFALLVMQDRVAEIADELEPFYRHPRGSSVFAEMYALALAASGRAGEARAAVGRSRRIRRDMSWLFITSARGLLAVALDDHDRAESAYQALQPYAARPGAADTGVMSLWPAAKILGDLARHLGLPSTQAHYEHALAGLASYVTAASSPVFTNVLPAFHNLRYGLAGPLRHARASRTPGLLRGLRPTRRPAAGNGPAHHQAGCLAARAAAYGSHVHQDIDRPGRRSAIPRQHRHAYAVDLQRGLPTVCCTRLRS